MNAEKLAEQMRRLELLAQEIRATHLSSDESEERVRFLAREFCRISDDAQARFFVAVAAEMSSWGPQGMDGQAYYIGEHLVTCECSSEAGRQLVLSLAESVKSAQERAGARA